MICTIENMIIMIEYSEGDRILYGKKISLQELRSRLRTVEELYDRKTDNFIRMFCSMYSWNELEYDRSVRIDYIYDRDTGIILKRFRKDQIEI